MEREAAKKARRSGFFEGGQLLGQLDTNPAA
jgi:hypothetical protein